MTSRYEYSYVPCNQSSDTQGVSVTTRPYCTTSRATSPSALRFTRRRGAPTRRWRSRRTTRSSRKCRRLLGAQSTVLRNSRKRRGNPPAAPIFLIHLNICQTTYIRRLLLQASVVACSCVLLHNLSRSFFSDVKMDALSQHPRVRWSKSNFQSANRSVSAQKTNKANLSRNCSHAQLFAR
jgi:hypothetical protein